MNFQKGLVASLVLLLLVAAASGPALAQHRGYYGGPRYYGGPVYRGPGYGYYGYGYGSGVGLGIGLGLGFGALAAAPFYAPYYYPPAYAAAPYYYPPLVAVPQSPPVYIDQGPTQFVPQQQAQAPVWYYCAASQAYYPYVNECPSGWQTVAPQPPQQPRQ